MEWKVGDWCFCEFKLQIIKEVSEDGRVNSVSDGMFYMGGYDLNDRCFPLTFEGKQISDAFAYSYDNLRKELRNGRYNFPDFNRHAVEEWIKAMEAGDVQEGLRLHTEFELWCQRVIVAAIQTNDLAVDGIRLMRR